MFSLTLGGFGGSLIFGGAPMGRNIVSWGSAMHSGDCMIILQGNLFMLFSSFISFGTLSLLGVIFCVIGWVSTAVGAFASALA